MDAKSSAPSKSFDSRRLLSPAVHILIVGILFILPEVLMRMASPWRGPTPMSAYLKVAIMIGVFYLNYFVIIPHTLVRGGSNRWWRFIGWNILVVAGATLLMYYINQMGGHHRRHRERDEWQIMMATASFILRDAIMLLLLISLAVMLRLSNKWVELERRQRELYASQRESELESLRAQLNPHFLFNTLNSIYALIAVSPVEAQKAVHELSGLLRYVVYENPDKVSVEREADFVRNYVELMRLRMGTRPVELEVDLKGDGTMPPLLFVTLVENAFKHGNTADPSKPISIRIEADDDMISCMTVNSVDGSAHFDSGKGGVGLANLRRHLELIYGDSASLEIDTDQCDVCRVCLVIPSK